MTNQRTTIVLSVIAGSLLAFILLFERGTLSTGDVAQRSDHVLSRFLRDQVTQVSLVRGDDEPIVLGRMPPPEEDPEALGLWELEEPVHAEADQDAVDSLMGALEFLMAERTLTGVTAEDRERYGLTHPRFVVRYRVAGEEGRLAVGGEAPEGQGIYVAADDEARAYVVGADLIESIDHGVDHFRDKDLFPEDFYGSDAVRVRLEGAGEPIAFEKEGERWHVREPVRGWANAGAVDRLLRLPREVHAARFAAEEAGDLARYGLDHPWRELTVTRPDDAHGTRVGRLRVGDACGEHTSERYALAGDEGPVVCVLTSELSPLELESGGRPRGPAGVGERRRGGAGRARGGRPNPDAAARGRELEADGRRRARDRGRRRRDRGLVATASGQPGAGVRAHRGRAGARSVDAGGDADDLPLRRGGRRHGDPARERRAGRRVGAPR